jgi:hypothetical protein
MGNVLKFFTNRKSREPHEGTDAETSEGAAIEAAVENQEECVRAKLEDVIRLIHPVLTDEQNDKAMIELGLAKNEFIEPLSKNEVIVIACGLHIQKKFGVFFNYRDIANITLNFFQLPMVTATIFNTTERLTAREFLIQEGKVRNDSTGRSGQVFSVSESGRIAFKVAIITSRILKEEQAQQAIKVR